jgi:hypothetical protein
MRYFNNALGDRRVFISINPSVGDLSDKYQLRSDLTKGVPLPKSAMSTTDIATTTSSSSSSSSDAYHSGNAFAIKTQADNASDPNMTVWTIAGAVKIENGEVDPNKIIEQTMAAQGTLSAGYSGMQPVTGLDNLRQMRYEFEIAKAEKFQNDLAAAEQRDAEKAAKNNQTASAGGNNGWAQAISSIGAIIQAFV